MKAVLFCRVSSREQEESGYSLPAQEKLLRTYAEDRGFQVVKKPFSISESAKGTKPRKIFKEMLDYTIEKDVKIIICEKADRMTRNFKDMILIDDWIEGDEKRQVHLVKDSLILHKNSRSQEKLNWGIRVLLAKNYSENLSEEVSKGTKEKAEEGWYPGNHKMGYIAKGEKGHKEWFIDNSEKSGVPFIKKAFDLYKDGNYSIKQLAKVMTNEGWRIKSGRPIIKSTLHKILSDCFYCGEFNWKNEHYPNAKHEPIISTEVFYAVQDKLKSKTTPRYRKHFSLFKGLMRCQECGGTISWEIQKSHWYGHCNHYKNCSQKKYVRQEIVEDQLLSHFDKILIKNEKVVEWIRKALKENHSAEIDNNKKITTNLNRQFSDIQRKLNMIYDDKLDNLITTEEYKKRFAELTNRKEEILREIHSNSNAQTQYFELGVNVFDLAQRAREIYLNREKVEDKRMLLNLIFSNIALNEGNLSITYSKAFEILAERVPMLNKSFEPQIQTSEIPVSTLNIQQNTSLRGALCSKKVNWLRSSDSNREPSR